MISGIGFESADRELASLQRFQMGRDPWQLRLLRCGQFSIMLPCHHGGDRHHLEELAQQLQLLDAPD